MDTVLDEHPLLPLWAQYTHLQWVVDRLGDPVKHTLGSKRFGLPS